MLLNIVHETPAEHRRLLLAGTAFISVLGLLIYLSIGIYNKTWHPVTMVTIKAERAGLQLAKFGDVRVNGVLVGQVRGISQDGELAEIKVGLDPDQARDIPENVTVEILPTTLFGQKYISLVIPDQPASEPLSDDDVIPPNRVTTNVELSRVLANLFPLLRSIRPADLNATLNALATGLSGRGAQLGETLERMDSWLGAIATRTPTLRQDLIALADVAQTYALAAPDLLGILRNATVTSKTIVAKEADLEAFMGDLTGLATTGSRVLERNEANLIRFGQVSEPLLRLLAVYAPQYPCLMRGLTRYTGRLQQIFEGQEVRQTMMFGSYQRPAYTARDRPVYGEVGHGPDCRGLPYPPVPIGDQPLKDGTDSYERQEEYPPTPSGRQTVLLGLTTSMGSQGYAGTPAEQGVVRAYLANRTGRSPQRFGSVSALLVGPLLRGREVSG